VKRKLRSRRDLTMKWCAETPRVSCVAPRGAFYAYPSIDIPEGDHVFVTELIRQKYVTVVHDQASASGRHKTFRIVFLPEEKTLTAAYSAIGDSCASATRRKTDNVGFGKGTTSVVPQAPLNKPRLQPLRATSAQHQVVTFPVSVDSRNQRRHSARIVFELGAKGLAQQAFFTSNADVGSGNNNTIATSSGAIASPPVRSHEHAEHARVDGVSHEAIRAVLNERVALHQARGQSPLLSQAPRGRIYQPHRSDCNGHGEPCQSHCTSGDPDMIGEKCLRCKGRDQTMK